MKALTLTAAVVLFAAIAVFMLTLAAVCTVAGFAVWIFSYARQLGRVLSSMSNIITLPDGSGRFVSTVVMSREEAMALPVDQRPLCYRLPSHLYHAVFESIGAASMCWSPPPSTNVFDSEQAAKVATELCFKIADELDKRGPAIGEVQEEPSDAEVAGTFDEEPPEVEKYTVAEFLQTFNKGVIGPDDGVGFWRHKNADGSFFENKTPIDFDHLRGLSPGAIACLPGNIDGVNWYVK